MNDRPIFFPVEELSLPIKEIEEAARILHEARTTHRQIAALPDNCKPRSLADGYAIQEALSERMGAEIIGWKIGCVAPAAQKSAGTDQPFSGPVLKQDLYASGSRIARHTCFVRALQAEFAVRLANDLPAGNAPFSLDEVADAIAVVLPALEVADSRYLESEAVGAASLIADGAKAGILVLGAREARVRDVDLIDGQIVLRVNGELVATGSGRNVMGNPLCALQWLANAMARRGASLKSGQIVSTGTSFGSYYAQPGDRAVADFGTLGAVDVEFARE
jgi:2-keto-4-pentenoate hydratase